MDLEIGSRLMDFSCGLFFMFQILGTLALYVKGKEHRLQRLSFFFMLYLLCISAFEFIVFFVYNFLGEQEIPITDMLQMTVVPLALFFLYRLTHTHGMRLRWAVFHAAPYVLAFLLYVVCQSQIVYDGILVVALVHSVGIISYGFVAIRKYNQQLLATFSSDENLSLRWMWQILFLFFLLCVTWFVTTQFGDAWIAAIYNVLCSVILGLFCYFVYRQEDMLEALLEAGVSEDEFNAKNSECHEETLTDAKDDADDQNQDSNTTSLQYHFADRFEQLFSEEKIYLQPTLNVNELATRLGTNRTYLSSYLNHQLNTTFYAYINQWRLMDAENLLGDPELSLEEVAMKSGFNSLTSFRRYFMSAKGMTPTSFRKKQKIC